jgi:hypothetical protein
MSRYKTEDQYQTDEIRKGIIGPARLLVAARLDHQEPDFPTCFRAKRERAPRMLLRSVFWIVIPSA